MLRTLSVDEYYTSNGSDYIISYAFRNMIFCLHWDIFLYIVVGPGIGWDFDSDYQEADGVGWEQNRNFKLIIRSRILIGKTMSNKSSQNSTEKEALDTLNSAWWEGCWRCPANNMGVASGYTHLITSSD